MMDVLQKSGKETINNNFAHTQLTTPKSNKGKPRNDSSGEETLSRASYTGNGNDEDYGDDEPYTTAVDADEIFMSEFVEK